MTDQPDLPLPEPEEITDPDLEAAQNQVQRAEEPEALTTDELLPEEETVEWEAPYEPSTPTRAGETPADEAREETIDERLAQEEPDEFS